MLNNARGLSALNRQMVSHDPVMVTFRCLHGIIDPIGARMNRPYPSHDPELNRWARKYRNTQWLICRLSGRPLPASVISLHDPVSRCLSA